MLFCCLMIIRLVCFPLISFNMFSILLVFYCIWCMRFVNIERKINTQQNECCTQLDANSSHEFTSIWFLFLFSVHIFIWLLLSFCSALFISIILFLLNMIFHYRTFSWVYAVAKFTQHPIHHRRFKMLSSFQIRRMPLDQSLSLSPSISHFDLVSFCAPFSTFSSSHR